MFNIKYQTFLSPIWKSFEFEFIAKSTDKTRSTLGKHCTTKKTKGNLNIFPCVGCIMGFTTYIYKLRCKDTDVKDSFIDHTTNPNTCKNYHKRRCNFSNGKLYQVMRDKGGWGNWKLNVLEKFKYSYNQQLKDKMEEEKQFHQPTLNRWAKPKKPPVNPLETYIIRRKEEDRGTLTVCQVWMWTYHPTNTLQLPPQFKWPCKVHATQNAKCLRITWLL